LLRNAENTSSRLPFRYVVAQVSQGNLIDFWGFFFTLTAALAEMERGIVAERTKAALAHKRIKGEKTGGDVPFGYDLESGLLVENREEQRILKGIQKDRGRGLSLRRIARSLEENGIPTKRGGASWHPQIVKQILRRAA
jgi:DNA invertase Pin-like site-specific DNA recombinase